tara:strand:- start:363 stop:569 length:207 start_codon:yes stop_codon:yes gene_type:complete
MRLILALQIFLFFLFPSKNYASRSYKIRTVCERFAAGNIDAYKTLEELELNVDDYSIGVNNTAKIFCS